MQLFEHKQWPSDLVNMERWIVRERACAVELFIRTRSITETQCGFRHKRNQQQAPSPNEIRRWVRQWREEGSVSCKKPPGRPSSVRTPDNTARETLQAVMRSFVTRVHLCIEEGGGHLKDTVHKKWHYVKKKLSTIVNCDVLKLVSITFSKMLFLFIISSWFLPHSVYEVKSALTRSRTITQCV